MTASLKETAIIASARSEMHNLCFICSSNTQMCVCESVCAAYLLVDFRMIKLLNLQHFQHWQQSVQIDCIRVDLERANNTLRLAHKFN